MQFSYIKIGNFPDVFTIEPDTPFLYTDIGNLHDDFMFLIEWRHFYTEIGKFPDKFWHEQLIRYAIFIGWVFSIFQVPYKKQG